MECIELARFLAVANIQSSLKKSQLIESPTSESTKDKARKAYHEFGLVLIYLDRITNPYFKQEIKNYADNEYGKRK